MSIRIAIVDDKLQNRAQLTHRLRSYPDVDVIFSAPNGNEFLEKIKIHPDVNVVLMDIEMPELDGIKTVEAAAQLYPQVKFIMLTVFDDEDKIFEAIKAGACGYLLKEESLPTIYNNIKEVIELGGAPMSPGIARKAFQMLSRAHLPETPVPIRPEEISDREMEILRHLVNGLEYKAIAEVLFISPHTVRKHIGNIYQKLHVKSKAQAIHLAIKKRLI